MTKHRIDVLHGVNLDQLGRRDPDVYGTFTLSELEGKIKRFAADLGFDVTFWQTNHEGDYCEQLHVARDRADGLVLNPGAWTHYSWAIRDAVEVAGLPFVEVHISDVHSREDWRSTSIFDGLALEKISGEGADGYRRALELLKSDLGV
jgi:3-dehydroquinate dehydratase-2